MAVLKRSGATPPGAVVGARRRTLGLLAGAGAVALGHTLPGCATINAPPMPAIDRGSKWALLPIVNLTETPQAGLRAESIVESLVRSAGLTNMIRYPASLNTDALFDPVERKAVEQAMTWARGETVRYALTGAVEEWRYKVGVDGEPAVGITLQVFDLKSGAVIWSAAGSRTGWSREALSAIAQKLVRDLIAPIGAAAP
jgi:TolB-like protein